MVLRQLGSRCVHNSILACRGLLVPEAPSSSPSIASRRPQLDTSGMRQKRMFDVGHTSNGMAFDVRCSSRLRRRFWSLDSVLLAGWNDLDLVAGVRFRVLLGAFLLERLACLLGHVLSRRFVGHGAPWLGAPADSQVRRYASSVPMTHEIGERRLAIRDTVAPVSAPAHQRASHSSLASRALGTMPRSGRSIDSEVKRSSPPKTSSIRHESDFPEGSGR